MRIGIIGAMEQEVAVLKERMELRETVELHGTTFYEGTLQGSEVVLLQSG
ncbi:MAG: 5'-methylthioadenosine/S-adenosylhomocysteine nucleosidase, partial [Bacilli bacterium]